VKRLDLLLHRFTLPEGFNLPGLHGTVYASVVFDDGGGPALYAGGDFTAAGGR